MSEDLQIINGLKSTSSERIYQEKVLYNQYSYFINEGCKKYNLNYEDGFTAYSDAVLSALHNIIADRFDGRSSLKTYLFQIFSNKCIDLVRKRTTNKQKVNETLTESELLGQLPDSTRTVIEKLIDDQKRKAIKQQLENIGDKCREILLLFEDSFTDRQIAEKLDYSNAAVAKTTRIRCLEKLRERMKHFLKIG